MPPTTLHPNLPKEFREFGENLMTAALVVGVNGLAPHVNLKTVKDYLWALFASATVHPAIRAVALRACIGTFDEATQRRILTRQANRSFSSPVQQVAKELLAQLGPEPPAPPSAALN